MEQVKNFEVSNIKVANTMIVNLGIRCIGVRPNLSGYLVFIFERNNETAKAYREAKKIYKNQ